MALSNSLMGFLTGKHECTSAKSFLVFMHLIMNIKTGILKDVSCLSRALNAIVVLYSMYLLCTYLTGLVDWQEKSGARSERRM